jgi:ribosome biogenesis GTPase
LPMSFKLSSLIWKPFFQQQLNLDEMESCYPARLSAVHRSCAELWSEVAEQYI